MWGDSKLREYAARFTPVTDEVWRLQRGTDPDCVFFQSFANQGHYGPGKGSKQGIYVVTPGGRLLASTNALRPGPVREVLEKGWRAWEELSESERLGDRSDALDFVHRWESSYPADGLVLRSVVIDLPESGAPDVGSERPRRRYNLDHAWFAASEFPWWTPPDLRVGLWYRVDARAVERLARFQVVDNVHGQALPFAPTEVSKSRISGRIVALDGQRVRVEFHGELRASADGNWRLPPSDWTPKRKWPRTYESQLLGAFEFDYETNRFLSFEFVALGEFHGTTGLNGRKPGQSGFVGHYFEIAPDTPAERVPPAFIDVYDVTWVVEPSREPSPR